MQIATWNVNSVRARLAAVCQWLATHRPEVLCLQETKVQDGDFPEKELKEVGYHAAFWGQKSYNGVALLSLTPLDDVRFGFPETEWNEQKRLMTATIHGVRIVNVYIPNGETPASTKFDYKLAFIHHLRAHLDQTYSPDRPVVLVGDFNVAPEPEDVYPSAGWEADVLFHPQSRAAIAHLAAWGFADVFRKYHAGGGHYSWWDYREAAFRRNLGARIDHIWASPTAAARCRACEIDCAPRGELKPSDHAPVTVTLE